MNEQELLELKREIEEAKENLSKLEGRKEQLLEQLQKQYGIKTLVAAEKKKKSLGEEIEEWDEKIREATEELENQLQNENKEAKD